MRAALIIGCVLLLVLGSAAAAPAAAQSDEDPAPSFVYEVDVDERGDAVWELRAEFPIETEANQSAFDQLATEYAEGDGDDYLRIDPYEVAVAAVEDELDRSMEIVEENRSVERGPAVGTLSLRFRWTGFAAVDGDEVHVGDAFDVGDQTWFSRLAADERLRIHGPANYTVADSGIPVENRTMTVDGPADLAAEDLQGTFVGGGSTSDGAWALPGSFVAGIGLLILLGGIVGYYWLTRRTSIDAPVGPSSADTVEEKAEPEDDGEEVDDTLLSDEERVLSLVEERDGRMKQAEIVNETDWSNAKVSQLLSQMEDGGTIEKLRIGRENLIRLPDGEEEE